MKFPALRLSPRDRRAVRIGGMLLLPVLAVLLVVLPYLGALAAAREELRMQRGLLVRERSLVAEAAFYPGLMDHAQALIEREAPRLFAGADEQARTGALAGYLRDQARRGGVHLQELRSPGPSPVDAGVRGITLEVRATGDLEGLLTLLTAVEDGERLVRVERLSLEGGPAGEAPVGAGDGELSLSATVRGFGLTPRPGEPAPPGSGGPP
jgi:hypothetical protein